MSSSGSIPRRRGRGAAGKVMCFTVALVAFATTAATASASIAQPAVPQLAWTDCGDGFDCATARVPLDYDQPTGATIRLKLIRLPATDPSRRIGSLFLNPGGPGGSGVDIVRQAGPFLFSPVWPHMARTLAKVEAALGEPAAAPDAADAVRELRAELGMYDNYPNFVEGGPGVACADTDNPSSPDAWSVAARDADREFGYFGRAWTWVSSSCAVWPGADRDRYTGPFTARTANPVLVIGNRYDPATRYQGAVTVSNLLPRARLLTLDGWGHTSAFLSACIDDYASRYLLTKALPPKDTVCKPDVIPFQEPANTDASRNAVIAPSIARVIQGA
jgi:hypothetical protein